MAKWIDDNLSKIPHEHGERPPDVSTLFDNLNVLDFKTNGTPEDIYTASSGSLKSWEADLRSDSEGGSMEAINGSQEIDKVGFLDSSLQKSGFFFLTDDSLVSVGDLNETAVLEGRFPEKFGEDEDSFPCVFSESQMKYEPTATRSTDDRAKIYVEVMKKYTEAFMRKLEGLGADLLNKSLEKRNSGDFLVNCSTDELKLMLKNSEKEVQKLQEDNVKLALMKNVLFDNMEKLKMNDTSNDSICALNITLRDEVENLNLMYKKKETQARMTAEHRNKILEDLRDLRKLFKLSQTRLHNVEEENSKLKKENNYIKNLLQDVIDNECHCSYNYSRYRWDTRKGLQCRHCKMLHDLKYKGLSQDQNEKTSSKKQTEAKPKSNGVSYLQIDDDDLEIDGGNPLPTTGTYSGSGPMDLLDAEGIF